MGDWPDYFRYWGKAARPEAATAGPAYHLLVYHALDVAAVGQVLLQKHHFLRQRLAVLMQLPEAETIRWCVFLLGIHDLGKFAETFQYLRPDLREYFRPQQPVQHKNHDVRHDSLGEMLWRQVLRKQLLQDLNAGTALKEWVSEHMSRWIQAVTGHHGQPPNANAQVRRHFAPTDQEAALTFLRDWQSLSAPDFASLPVRQAADQARPSWLLAGLAVLCDWLGSNQEQFTYYTEQNGLSLPAYWEQVALPTAEQALEEARLLPAQPAHNLSFRQLFQDIHQPTPLQSACEAAIFTPVPQLFMLEDVTGAGKTEAALMLAHRIISQGMAEGFYIGLPTMATANAMYERMAATGLHFYQAGETPSLILSHSARHLSPRFRQSLLDAHRGVTHYNTEESVSAQCSRWLADNRKKALLADVGVGTIDQALLGVLPVRHQSLRLLGLSNKVLILDEVHAYDAYTGELLRALVKFHAALGGSIILLSATLTRRQREKLAHAFGAANFVSRQSANYPLLTRIAADGNVEETALQTRESVRRAVDVQFLHEEAAVLAHIRQAAAEGKSVCWIRNTVPDARKAFETLAPDLPAERLHLFHSRYTLHDRLRIETDVLDCFGKDSTPSQRNSRVLIATQVVEQSLDLDFDVMITDLAPIDLLIQRAGRLKRHNRDPQGQRLAADQPDQRGRPVLTVYSPPFTDNPERNWYQAQFPGADHVYPHTLILWRTARILQQQGGWFMPADAHGRRGARDMLEFVYDAETDIPAGLERRTLDAIGADMSKTDAGDFAALKLESGYHKDHHWDEEARYATRLGEETRTVYLARQEPESGAAGSCRLSPWIDEGRYRWDLSSVRVSCSQLAEAAPVSDPLLQEALAQLRAQETRFDENSVIIPLTARENGVWLGYGLDAQGQPVTIHYDAITGLQLQWQK
ncbi:MAG TPA: CRISPR-associated helicase Cas3' [Thiolinea sp.]|nr:CRISPR-associated helicase Cas3' [Thiolinea sp.]